ACERAGLLCLPVLRTYRERELEQSINYTKAAGMVIPSKFKDFDYYQMAKELQGRLGMPGKIMVLGDEVPADCISLKKIMSTPLEKKYPPSYLQDKKCQPWEFSLITVTSGSTGIPKYAENPLYTRLHTARLFHIRPDDICAALSPAATGPNQGNYYGAPQIGAKVVWLEAFEAEEAFRLIQRERVTYLTAVPAQLALMIRHPAISKYEFSSLRLILSTGAFLAYHIGLEAEEKFGCPVIQTYGAVDVGGISMGSPEASKEERLLTAGKPLLGAEVKMVDDNGKEVARGNVGEICVRGPTTVSGFYKDPDATAKLWSADGWTKVGDLGKFDEKGNIAIMGRKKDMIIRGGQNIYPAEIENLLLKNPRVFSVAIVGMPDPIMGEKACAYVVPKPGLS
ncbi:MAG: fatty acid--CoA ligase family protein, partial [Dehalococcoidia bacterium]|nr:fatty acid--CoA ligase family protein [Dehalococcoidia bacterium]